MGIIKSVRPPHWDKVKNRLSFHQAYAYLSMNSDEIYFTTGINTPFTAKATISIKSDHWREKVIIFFKDGKEQARAYECCWGYRTNCHRTYIDCFTEAL